MDICHAGSSCSRYLIVVADSRHFACYSILVFSRGRVESIYSIHLSFPSLYPGANVSPSRAHITVITLCRSMSGGDRTDLPSEYVCKTNQIDTAISQTFAHILVFYLSQSLELVSTHHLQYPYRRSRSCVKRGGKRQKTKEDSCCSGVSTPIQ